MILNFYATCIHNSVVNRHTIIYLYKAMRVDSGHKKCVYVIASRVSQAFGALVRISIGFHVLFGARFWQQALVW